MNTRSRTIASFFSVAMAAMLFGAVVTSQIQRPMAAEARNPDPAASPAPVGPGGSITLDTFKEISRRQTAGVVNIGTKKVVRRGRGNEQGLQELFGDDFMERFFGPQGNGGSGGGGGNETQRSLGSGMIIDKDGTILTNRHVIDGADEITVSVGRHDYVAKLLGKDARTDVALLKIEPKEPLTVLALGNSDETEVGEWVMAVGNPFGLGGNSVTVGVVSYKGRAIPLGVVQGTSVDMIQTDAAINPGNSGGPLLNTRGEVIGINTLIITRGVPQSAGVGFAVPINVAKEILPQLRQRGKVVRGWLGVKIQALTDDMARTYRMKDNKGALISDVTPDSPAEKAGLKPDDVVVGVDGKGVEDNSDLSRYIASKSPGTTVNLRVLRGGAEQTIAVTLGTFPEETADADEGAGHRGQLGMTLRNLTPDMADRLELPRTSKGVVVTAVEAGEAAEEAGLARGDVIVSVNGSAIASVADFEREIDRARPDGVARLRVRRQGGEYSFLVLKLK
jgi:serine protease Do